MKKMLALVLAVLMVLSMAACGGETNQTQAGGNDATGGTQSAGEKLVVGVCQLMPHDALDAATQGFEDTLKAEFGENVDVVVKKGAGDSTTCIPIIDDFVADEVDLIMANATPALVTAANATEDIPILGTSVTEYGVALELDDFNGTVGGNVSGTSDLAPLDKQADMILEWFPDAKKVGLLYCSAEANSLYQVNEVQEYLEAKGITCTQYPFSDTNELQAVTQKASDESDVIYIPTDNTVAGATGTVDQVCRGVTPVIAGEEGICKGCGVATLSISYYDLGVATANMAIKILKGEADISTMAIGYAETQTPKYNPDICEAFDLTPPEGYEAIEMG